MKPVLTFGFELEGVCEKEFWSELQGYGNFTHDGSVRSYELGRGKEKVEMQQIDYCEFRSKVFTDSDKLLLLLDRFKNDKNYFSNKSCGLHLHIGSRNSEYRAYLVSLLRSYRILTNLQNRARELCHHIKRERTRCEYCQFFPRSLSDMFEGLQSSSKYHFVNFHEQGTLEFRFFSACQHKVKNVADFLDTFLHEIGKPQVFRQAVYSPPRQKHHNDYDLLQYQRLTRSAVSTYPDYANSRN